MNTWQTHHRHTKNKPPSELLREAVSLVHDKSRALDLGAGALIESTYLLAQGFAVTAVDRERPPEEPADENFTFVHSSFREYAFPEDTFDIVVAHFSLPLAGKGDFAEVWKKTTAALKPGGIFVGQLFGVNDEWNAADSPLMFHSKAEAEELVAGFEILKFREVDADRHLADGTPKHWHVFHIIARKRG